MIVARYEMEVSTDRETFATERLELIGRLDALLRETEENLTLLLSDGYTVKISERKEA